MEITANSVVVSLAGHDKGGVFAVVGAAGSQYVWIADGRRRKVEKPKRKKIRHLRPIGTLEPLQAGVRSNRSLRLALKAFPVAGDTNVTGEGLEFVQRRCD